MKLRPQAWVIPAGVAVAAAVAVGLWLSGSVELPRRTGMAPVPMYFPAEFPGRRSEGPGEVASGPTPPDWPGFRGPNRDGIRPAGPPLAESWPAGGPPVLWEIELGDGYGGAAVRDGKVYVLDYDEDRKGDVLRCLSLDNGEEIWRRYYKMDIPDDHGYSRTIPAATSEHVVAFSPACHVLCTDAEGEYLWSIDLVQEYEAEVPKWYAGQCPLIDRTEDGREYAVIAPGGTSLMIAAWCEPGEPRADGTKAPKLRWVAENPHGWQMTHSSITPMTFTGETRTWNMYVYPAGKGVVGIERDTGEILWTYEPWAVAPANIPAPIDCGDGRILCAAGYQAGSVLIRLREVNGQIVAEQERRFTPEQFGAYQQTPIFYRSSPDDPGHVYGVMPAGKSGLTGQLVCMSPEGEIKWASGKRDRFKWGPYVIADGKILAMNDSGVLTMARATPAGYERLAHAEVFPRGKEAWGPPAVAGDKLIVRDFTRMRCLDLSAE